MTDDTQPSPPPTPPTPPTKPGWRTTEFYGAWAVKILGALMSSGVLGDGTTASRIVGAVLTLLGFLGYTYSRTILKAASVLALAVLLAGPQIACSGARGRGAAAAGAFLDCQAPNVVAALPDAIALAKAAVMRWIAGDGAVDTSGLKSDASKMAGDLGKCAFDAAIAALATPPPAQKVGAPAAAALVIDGPQLGARWAQVRGELGWAPEAPR